MAALVESDCSPRRAGLLLGIRSSYEGAQEGVEEAGTSPAEDAYCAYDQDLLMEYDLDLVTPDKEV